MTTISLSIESKTHGSVRERERERERERDIERERERDLICAIAIRQPVRMRSYVIIIRILNLTHIH